MSTARAQGGSADAGPDGAPGAGGEANRVVCHLDRLLEARGMTLASLADRAGITAVNLSVLKNNRAKAIRFSTLLAICSALDCGVGDLLEIVEPPGPPPGASSPES